MEHLFVILIPQNTSLCLLTKDISVFPPQKHIAMSPPQRTSLSLLTKNTSLSLLPKTDADEAIDRLAWASDPLAVAAIAMTMGCLILVAACVSCWACKSRERRKERIMRRNSIRASIRSNRSAISTSTTTGGFSDITRRRIIEVGCGAKWFCCCLPFYSSLIICNTRHGV